MNRSHQLEGQFLEHVSHRLLSPLATASASLHVLKRLGAELSGEERARFLDAASNALEVAHARTKEYMELEAARQGVLALEEGGCQIGPLLHQFARGGGHGRRLKIEGDADAAAADLPAGDTADILAAAVGLAFCRAQGGVVRAEAGVSGPFMRLRFVQLACEVPAANPACPADWFQRQDGRRSAEITDRWITLAKMCALMSARGGSARLEPDSPGLAALVLDFPVRQSAPDA